MARITLLPPMGPPSGDEMLPIVKDGKTFSVPVSLLTEAASNRAEAAAAFAEEFSGRPYSSQAEGEAETTEGQFFRVWNGDSPRTYTRYERTAIGSEIVAPLATSMHLASAAGAASMGVQSGGTAQDYFSAAAVPLDAFLGSTDQKLAAAVAALPSEGGVIQFGRGTYTFASQHVFTKAVILRGHGFSASVAGTAATQVMKAAELAEELFVFLVDQSGLEDIGIAGEAGNAGDGVAVRAGRFRGRNVSIHGMGRDNIRFGQDGVASNTNLMSLINVLCRGAGRHNFHFHDGNPYASTVNPATGKADGANCNAGVLIGCEASAAGGDNYRFEQSWWMTGVGLVGQVATGAGLRTLGAGSNGSRNHVFIGGDFNENNAGGNIVNGGFECEYHGVAAGAGFTDTSGTATVINSAGAAMRALRVSNVLTSERPTSGGSTTDYPIICRVFGGAANARGAGIQFEVPNGGASSRVGGRVSVRQDTANRDSIYFTVNNLGVLQDVLVASSFLTGLCPTADDGFNLGHVSKRFNTLFLGTGGVNVSGKKVLGQRGAALPPDATDLASVIALANAMKARLIPSTGHGLVEES